MHGLLRLAVALVMTGCGVTVSSPTDSQSPSTSQAVAEPPASSDRTASPPPSVVEADGTFVFVPAAIDCPGGCPSSSVSEALAEPGVAGTPLLVEGAVLIDPDGSAWFCEGLSEHSPPLCSGARLLFDNVELYAPSLEVNGVQELDGVQWLDDVTIPGEVTPGP
jgi:hypothetical protein